MNKKKRKRKASGHKIRIFLAFVVFGTITITLGYNILKLNDPDYIAKYVREKYFYSKEGELILRIDD